MLWTAAEHDWGFREGGDVDRCRHPRPRSHGSHFVVPRQRWTFSCSALQWRVSEPQLSVPLSVSPSLSPPSVSPSPSLVSSFHHHRYHHILQQDRATFYVQTRSAKTHPLFWLKSCTAPRLLSIEGLTTHEFLFYLSSCIALFCCDDLELDPMTLKYEFDLDMLKMYHRIPKWTF